jgi:hypothetical protein
MTDRYAQVTGILRDHGCTRVEQVNEDTEKWHNPKKGRRFYVPRPVDDAQAERILREELDIRG